MKHGTAIGCIEFNGANIYSTPPTADPNEANLNLEVKVYKLNPDGSKGELIRTEKKEEEKMYPRKDRDEIVATAKKLMAEGKSMTKAVDEPAPPLKMNYDQAVNQLTLGFIIEIYASDLDPVDKLGLIAKQIDVWKEL